MANVDEAKQAAGDLAQQAREMAEQTYRQYEPEVQRFRTELAQMLRHKPIQTIAIAGAIAFALGALWRR